MLLEQTYKAKSAAIRIQIYPQRNISTSYPSHLERGRIKRKFVAETEYLENMLCHGNGQLGDIIRGFFIGAPRASEVTQRIVLWGKEPKDTGNVWNNGSV